MLRGDLGIKVQYVCMHATSYTKTSPFACPSEFLMLWILVVAACMDQYHTCSVEMTESLIFLEPDVCFKRFLLYYM